MDDRRKARARGECEREGLEARNVSAEYHLLAQTQFVGSLRLASADVCVREREMNWQRASMRARSDSTC